MDKRNFQEILTFLQKIPSISTSIGTGGENGMWWIKFSIDIHHKLAWNVVQEFGHILNYLSLNERLPTRFYPVSPPVYMNGGPDEFLSWVIENTDPEFVPGKLKKWLEGRLPNPVEDENEWLTEE